MIHLQFWVYGSWDSLFPISMSPNCKLMSPEHYFYDKSAILLHPGTRWNKTLHPRDKIMRKRCRMSMEQNHWSLKVLKWASGSKVYSISPLEFFCKHDVLKKAGIQAEWCPAVSRYCTCNCTRSQRQLRAVSGGSHFLGSFVLIRFVAFHLCFLQWSRLVHHWMYNLIDCTFLDNTESYKSQYKIAGLFLSSRLWK